MENKPCSNKDMKIKRIFFKPSFLISPLEQRQQTAIPSPLWRHLSESEIGFPYNTDSSAILKRKSIPLPSFWPSTRISSYLCSLSLPPSSQNPDKEVDKSPQGLSWATAAQYRKQESAMELREGENKGYAYNTHTHTHSHSLSLTDPQQAQTSFPADNNNFDPF